MAGNPAFIDPTVLLYLFLGFCRLRRRDLLKLIPPIFPPRTIKHPPCSSQLLFKTLISSQREAAGHRCGADLVWDRHRIHQNAAAVPVALLPIVARNQTYHPLLGGKIVKSLSTVAVHLCTRSFPPLQPNLPDVQRSSSQSPLKERLPSFLLL